MSKKNIMQEEISIAKAIAQLSLIFCRFIMSGTSLLRFPPVMLWGAPGVGKSQGVRQLAAEIEKNTGKEVIVIEVRLLLFSPIDLRGIPSADAEKKFSVWLMPKIFDMDPSSDKVYILFLDEISAAPQSVQAAAYQLTLDRKIGEHALPGNCVVIAAGNRVTDKSVAFKMPKALANRLCHIDIGIDFQGWREWAVKNDVHPKIIGFLAFRRDCLFQFDSAYADANAFPTPRSWEMCSNIVKHLSDDIGAAFSLISGCVGLGPATELMNWFEIYEKIPAMEDIFSGEHEDVPESVDMLFAVVSAMVDHAKEHHSDKDLGNAINYGLKLQPDFTAMFFSDLMFLDEDFRKGLMKNKKFREWLLKQGKER